MHGLTAEGVRAVLPPSACVDTTESEFVFGDGADGADGAQAQGGWWRGGRETTEGVLARAAAVVERLWELVRAEEEDCAYALVIHGLFNHRMLRLLLGVHPEMDVRFLTCNCALTVLELRCEGAAAAKAPESAGGEQGGGPLQAPALLTRRVAVLAMDSLHHIPPRLHTGASINGWKMKPLPLPAGRAD